MELIKIIGLVILLSALLFVMLLGMLVVGAWGFTVWWNRTQWLRTPQRGGRSERRRESR